MFFNSREFHAYLHEPSPSRRPALHSVLAYHGKSSDSTLTYEEARVFLSAMKKRILSRDFFADNSSTFNGFSVFKFLRPWSVVPALRNFRPPVGDYGIGVEVEFGFRQLSDARYIANKIKSWKYVAMDYEGGRYGIETTFAPTLYSKWGRRSQAWRYVRLLELNTERLANHHGNAQVGTHINVSKGGVDRFSPYGTRRSLINSVLSNLSSEHHQRYFGRRPYGYINDMGSWVEMKLFDSVADTAALNRYVNIAVSLVDLMTDETAPITTPTVLAALEAGYTKR